MFSVINTLCFDFKLAEFFSGPGGMGYGAGLSKVKDNSIEHAWASDYDQDSCNTYKRNIKTKAIFCEKVENFFNLVDKKKLFSQNLIVLHMVFLAMILVMLVNIWVLKVSLVLYTLMVLN